MGIRSVRELVMVVLVLAGTAAYNRALGDTVTFTKDGQSFEVEFVTIDAPGNPPDEPDHRGHAWGAVDYVYQISKYEMSVLAGVVAADVTGEVRDELSVLPLSASWPPIAEIVNFLNTSTGYHAAYNLKDLGPNAGGIPQDLPWDESDAGYDPNNPWRNSLARYVIPTADEWHKAAYYDPETGNYFDYANGSNDEPTTVDTPTVSQDEVVYYGDINGVDVQQAGGLSPFGTMGQTGNGPEWEEGFYIDGFHAMRSGTGFFRETLKADRSRTFPVGGGGLRVVRLLPISDLLGDFDANGILDASDMDLLSLQLRVMTGDLLYDLNSDGVLDAEDRTSWIIQAGTRFGDADLNGTVEFADFLQLSANFHQETGWAGGDFDGNGMAEFADFLLLSANFDKTGVASVPEPTAESLMLLLFAASGAFRRRR